MLRSLSFKLASSELQVRSAVRKRWHRWQDNHSLRMRVARAMSIPTSPTRISFHSIKQTTAVWAGAPPIWGLNLPVKTGVICLHEVVTHPHRNMCPVTSCGHKTTRDSYRWGDIINGPHLVIWQWPLCLSIHERKLFQRESSSRTRRHLLYHGLGEEECSPFN